MPKNFSELFPILQKYSRFTRFQPKHFSSTSRWSSGEHKISTVSTYFHENPKSFDEKLDFKEIKKCWEPSGGYEPSSGWPRPEVLPGDWIGMGCKPMGFYRQRRRKIGFLSIGLGQSRWSEILNNLIASPVLSPRKPRIRGNYPHELSFSQENRSKEKFLEI